MRRTNPSADEPMSSLPIIGSFALALPRTADDRQRPILMVLASTDLPEPGGATKMSITSGRIEPPHGSYGQIAPFGRRNSTDPRSQGEIVCDHGRSGIASPSGASEGLAVEASARPGTELITPSSGSPATRAVLQLPHPSILCASVEARRLSFRVSPRGAQVAKEARSFTEIWFSCSRKLRSDAKARWRSRLAGKIDRNDDPISLNAMPVLPP